MVEPRDNERNRILCPEEEGRAQLWGKALATGRGKGLGTSVSSNYYNILHDIERGIITGLWLGK